MTPAAMLVFSPPQVMLELGSLTVTPAAMSKFLALAAALAEMSAPVAKVTVSATVLACQNWKPAPVLTVTLVALPLAKSQTVPALMVMSLIYPPALMPPPDTVAPETTVPS